MPTTRFRIHRRTGSLLLALGLALTVWTSIVARETAPANGLALTASLSERTLTVRSGGETVKVYDVAVGTGKHPTPAGTYSIRKIVWNPAWVPPDQKWAEGKVPQGPGDPENPMRVVKIFFREPAYYIHGTDATGSLGRAASHGCLRMDPDEAGELALMVMENAGVSRDWDWVKGILNLGESRTVSLERPARLSIVP
ncbi:MAG TPA: L,D-transpeptidase [Gemmatimonadaceae bacterium]|nr:L,D-transpeptidase [Gemmatimonadaceae bacterium]